MSFGRLATHATFPAMPTRILSAVAAAALAVCALASCAPSDPAGFSGSELRVESPDGSLAVAFALDADGTLRYALTRGADTLIRPSALGLTEESLGPLRAGFRVASAKTRSGTEAYDLPWGEVARVEAGFREGVVALEHAPTGLRFDVVARLFDDGLGLRYRFPPEQGAGLGDSLRVLEEHTGFRVSGDPLVNWGPGDWNSYENPVELTRLSAIDAAKYDARDQLISRVVPHNALMTPATLQLDGGTVLSLHEAALIDYPEMTLGVVDGGFESILCGTERRRAKAVRALPFETPWRTVQVEDRAIDLVANTLILNLNPPNELGDVSWFEPMTYAGVWWEMHLGVGTWDYAGGSTSPTPEAAAIMASRGVSSRHAANTTNVKRYIDFCAENNIRGLLVEGWNTGWEVWLDPEKRAEVFDFVTPYPDYDLEEVVRYGRERDVAIIMHHETSASVPQYERQQDTAYALMQGLGIHAAKTGYVGNILPEGEYRHGQYMVRHYRNTFRKAAEYEIAINPHEAVKQTGERRTLPNAISAEAAKGMEYNSNGKLDGGVNPPEHLASMVYTRCLAGPFDYTPGIFRLDLEDYRGPGSGIGSTLGKQLGAYVVVYAPVQMVADLPEHYQRETPRIESPTGQLVPEDLVRRSRYPRAMDFLRGMATNWDDTYPLAGELGEYAVVARKVRGEDRYFIGGVGGKREHTVTVPLGFLPAGKTYEGTLYADAPDTDYRTNPEALRIENLMLSSTDSLTVTMKPSGGFGAVLELGL